MPTNVTAEYKKAEQAFRQARDLDERLACLKEMLRTIPKHKGTEHLQAGLKTRIKQLTDEFTGPKKGGSHAAALYAVSGHPTGINSDTPKRRSERPRRGEFRSVPDLSAHLADGQ